MIQYHYSKIVKEVLVKYYFFYKLIPLLNNFFQIDNFKIFKYDQYEN